MGMSVLFITHDRGVVAEMANRVVVMYTGRAVEDGPFEEVLVRPRMPSTIGLLNSVPKHGGARGRQLETIPGNVPNPLSLPGCSFHPRCFFARDGVCNTEVPPPVELEPGHRVRCARHDAIREESE